MGELLEPWCPVRYLTERHPGVRVVEKRLPGSIQGCVDHEQRIIWIDSGLSVVQRRCTLAFEIGQLQLGPVSADPRWAAAHQREAAEWAAQMLIAVTDLIAAFQCCPTITDMAGCLGVDLPTVRTRIRCLTDDEQDDAMAAVHSDAIAP